MKNAKLATGAKSIVTVCITALIAFKLTQAVNWLYGTLNAEAVIIVTVLTLFVILLLMYLMFATHNKLGVWSLSAFIAFLILIISFIIIARFLYLKNFLKFPANIFIGLVLGFLIATFSFFILSRTLRGTESIAFNPIMKILLGVIFLSYLMSGFVGSNRGFVTETIKTFTADEPFTLKYYSGIDSLNISANFHIIPEWLNELNLKDNIKIAKLQDMSNVSCQQIGLVIDCRVNLGFAKLADIANTPCRDTMVQKVALIWTGFTWKVLFSTVAGMA